MSYSCKILLDSISETGKRITTFEITFPRIILAEFNTHRMFSCNSASSRAIPLKKQIKRIKNDTFIPEQFPENCVGMQPQQYINNNRKPETFSFLKEKWLEARDNAINIAEIMGLTLNVHKQIVNGLLEPFQWHIVIVTATEFDNFFKLRTHPDAQYEIKRIADLMYEAYHAWDNVENATDNYNERVSRAEIFPDNDRLGLGWTAIQPQKLKVGEWHCPLILEEDFELAEIFLKKKAGKYELSILPNGIYEVLKRISVARCARVPYLTHDGKRDIEKDLELFERLRTSSHWSPFEHVATPYFIDKDNPSQQDMQVYREGKLHINKQNVEGYVCFDRSGYYGFNLKSGNFIGWKQYRKEFQDENCTNFIKEN